MEVYLKNLYRAILGAVLAVAIFAAPAQAANWFQSHVWKPKTHHVLHVQKVHIGTHHKLLHVRHFSVPPVVVAHVSISSQSMTVDVNGWPEGHWAISSARPGYHTPRGDFHVTRMAKVYYSKKYDNSPMPNSVFFLGGFAIHGTYHIGGLGHPASHGCVRLAPANAATLYALVQEYGPSRSRVIITD